MKKTKKHNSKKSKLTIASKYYKALNNFEKQLNNCYTKLNHHIKHHANKKTLRKDTGRIMLILGECNYLMKDLKRNKKFFKRTS